MSRVVRWCWPGASHCTTGGTTWATGRDVGAARAALPRAAIYHVKEHLYTRSLGVFCKTCANALRHLAVVTPQGNAEASLDLRQGRGRLTHAPARWSSLHIPQELRVTGARQAASQICIAAQRLLRAGAR